MDFSLHKCLNIYNLMNSQFSNFLERTESKLLGNLKHKYSWHDLMVLLLCPAPNDAFVWRLPSVWSLSVCLSRTSGLTREQRGLGRLKLARDWDTTFKVKRSKVKVTRPPGRFTQRGLNAWGRCSGDRENVSGVGNYCYVASARRRARRWGAHGGGKGRGISYRYAHSLLD